MKNNLDKFFISSIYLVWALIVFAFLYDFSDKVYWRSFLWAILFSVSLFCFYKIKSLSLFSNLVINILITLSIFGEIILELYYKVPYYDKFLHLSVPFCIFFIAYDGLKPYFDNHLKLLKACLIIVVSLIFIWELLEIGFDYFFDAPLIGVFIRSPVEGVSEYQMKLLLDPLRDTIYDMVAGIISVFLAFAISLNLLKKQDNKIKRIP